MTMDGPGRKGGGPAAGGADDGGDGGGNDDPNVIRRETFIAAPVARVWSLVSHVGFWVGPDVRFDGVAAEGETVTIDAGECGRFPVRVERLEPPRYAAYRWASAFPGAALSAANSTLVEFDLAEQDGGVVLRVTESGFAGLAGTVEFRRARRADNVGGWAAQLARLAAVAESTAHGAAEGADRVSAP
jgi:uncharacterized protein YndB with AHSA1/START domain